LEAVLQAHSGNPLDRRILKDMHDRSTHQSGKYPIIHIPSPITLAKLRKVRLTIRITCTGNQECPKPDAANPRQVDAVVMQIIIDCLL